MTERVQRMLTLLRSRTYRGQRADGKEDGTAALSRYEPMRRSAEMLAAELAYERPLLFGEDDLFGFNRYRRGYMTYEGEKLIGFGNVTIDYERVLAEGLDGIAGDIRARYDTADDKARTFYGAVLTAFKACLDMAEQYRREAERQGNTRLAGALRQVPHGGARDYYEALVTVKFLQFVLRLNHMEHVTLGRFDRYMLPYWERSRAAGATREDILEYTELFFISLNFDVDLYTGIQQGDNGQSLMLGGCDEAGNDAFGELSEICLTASEELMLADPKINLRVNKNTPVSRYERCTRLTRQGLGFPQYSNDDVVIPALERWGYATEDARNYTVAACWEFIVPRCGADIPNIEVLNFPLVVDRALRKHLATSPTFEAFLGRVKEEVGRECDAIRARADARGYLRPEPFLSAFIGDCVLRGRDLTEGGAKYNNFGVHGAGLSNAADALAAVRRTVYETKSVTPERLIAALDADFEGYAPLRQQLSECPKMGNDDDYVDSLGGFLLDAFGHSLSGRPNSVGGLYRAGTGSAMEYVREGEKVGATADGRKAGQPFAANFSPALGVRTDGPVSAIRSFTKFDFTDVANGGPFTVEIHDTVFRNDEGERKVARLVKAFIDLGGHQIQINSVSRERLLDAREHPENYPGLIVRVWGWSGYFVELAPVYQDHIIRRTEYIV